MNDGRLGAEYVYGVNRGRITLKQLWKCGLVGGGWRAAVVLSCPVLFCLVSAALAFCAVTACGFGCGCCSDCVQLGLWAAGVVVTAAVLSFMRIKNSDVREPYIGECNLIQIKIRDFCYRCLQSVARTQC